MGKSLDKKYEELQEKIKKLEQELVKAKENVRQENEDQSSEPKNSSDKRPSKKREAEQLLKQEHQILEIIFEHTHMMIAFLDTSFNFVKVNRAFAQDDERDPSFFPGKNYFDLYPSADNKKIFRQVIKTGKPHFEYAKPFKYAGHPERGVTYWDWSLLPVKANSSGKVIGLILSLLDVTERILATKDLAMFKAIVEASQEAIIIFDAEGHLLYFNPAHEKIFGRSYADVRNKNYKDYYPPQVLEVLKRELIPALQRGESWEGILELVDKNGRQISVWERADIVRDADGNMLFGFGVMHDVTEKIASEKKLQQQAERLKVLHEIDQAILRAQSPEEIAEAALKHLSETVHCHHCCVAEFDAFKQEVIILACRDGNHGITKGARFHLKDYVLTKNAKPDELHIVDDIATLPEKPQFLQKFESAGVRSYFNIPLTFQNDLIGWINLGNTQPEAFNDEDYIQIAREMATPLAIAIQQARLYEKVKNYARDLEQRVLERTKELNERIVESEKLNRALLNILEDLQASNRHLEETTKKLEAANADLEAFSSSISHDLRAPLRAINGFSGILLNDYRDKLDEEGQKFLTIIHESSQKMRKLIEDLLKFAHTSRKQLKPTQVNMEKLVQEVVDELKQNEPERDITIEVNKIASASADSAMIRQVFINLISNAIKFTRPVKIAKIEIGSKIDDKEIVYYVKDNGIGFDMKYAHKLFGVFQRLHGDDEFEGTGIGLGIVHRIINKHGGRVWAEAAPGKGATFYFSLPVN